MALIKRQQCSRCNLQVLGSAAHQMPLGLFLARRGSPGRVYK
jgi:hypothetical protein